MGKPPTMSRPRWVLRQLATLGLFFLGLSGGAAWALVLMGQRQVLVLWWWTYPVYGTLALWWAVQRLIEDRDPR